jgi:hypothetical protein
LCPDIGEEVHELRGVIERRGMSNDDHLRKMGQLDKLIQKHGTRLTPIVIQVLL